MTEPPRPPPDAPAAQAALAALRARFVEGLGPRWQAIVAAPGPAACAAELHRLAGAAGAYGFDALGTAARRAEQALLRGEADAARCALAALRVELVSLGVTVR